MEPVDARCPLLASLPGLAAATVLFIVAGAFGERITPAAETATSGTKVTTTPTPLAEGSLSGFQLKKGFRLEMAASEALVSSPIAMAFDENGRLFVAELRDYPNQQDKIPHLGRIRLLEDTDGDGVFDASTVYAENLAWPSAIACYGGGLFVASTPEILYLKDVNGDGVADSRKIVFSGFGGTNLATFDTLLNSFQWGTDNRIHGAAAGLEGPISSITGGGAESVNLQGDDFVFDGRSLTLAAEAGSGQSGLAFDVFGRRFVTDYSRPLRLAVLESHYLYRNPFFAAPDPMARVLGAASPVYLFNSEGPRLPPGKSTTGARTAPAPLRARTMQARGTVIYRGNAFPSNYMNNAFIADSEAHVIRRVLLRDNGLEVVALRATDEPTSEFLSSSDPSFRPTQIINSPEGVLYVADFQAGGDRGRILRIVPENFKQPKLPQLGKAKTYDLVAAVAQGNGWHQDTASRLLYERRDPACVALFTNMLFHSRLPLARLRAMHALEGQGALNDGVLVQALRDIDEHVREHAVMLVEKALKNGVVADSVWNQLKLLAGDPSIRVRYQLALTLGDIRHPDRPFVLRDVLSRNFGNPWMRPAALSCLDQGAPDFLISLAGDPSWRNDPYRRQFLLQVATTIGLQGRMVEVTQVLSFLDSARFESVRIHQLLHALGEGLLRTGSSLALVDPQYRLRRFYDQTEESILNDNVTEEVRIAALRLRSVSPYTISGSGDFLQLLFGSNQSIPVQAAAIATLGRYNNPSIPDTLFGRWRELSPALRTAAITAFLGRSDRIASVLAALEGRRISFDDLTPTQINLLRTFPDVTVSQRAVRLFGPFQAKRQGAVEPFRISLKLSGSPARGKQNFIARCASCHGVGPGPHPPDYHLDFSPLQKERLLHAIVEPSAGLRPSAGARVVIAKTGDISTGRLTRESQQSLVLQQANGTEIVLPKANVLAVHPQPWSIMPEGLERGFSPQDMADLMEYVIQAPMLPSENVP